MSLLFLLTTALCAIVARGAPANASAPIFELPYGSYSGFHNASSGLNVWRSIRYAAPPLGDLRWAAAQEPETAKSFAPIDATQFPLQCVQSKNTTINGEDCLFASVYAPAAAHGKDAKKLPVLVWIHGGAWLELSMREFDPTPMITSTNNSFIAVIIQYRMGALGFLSSPAIRAAGGLNAGITDAQFALKWVHQYIGSIGGDNKKVTVWGQSAGGGTVLDLVAGEYWAQKDGGEVLFEGAIASSPFQLTMLSCDDVYFKNQYANFLSLANCTDLACLRGLNTTFLQAINTLSEADTAPPEESVYVPCIEGHTKKGKVTPYLRASTTSQFLQKQVAGKYALAGNNNHDGVNFVSTSLNNTNGTTADAVLKVAVEGWFPIDNASFTKIAQLYPLANFTDNHARGAQIFQDGVFGCPVNWLLDAFGEHGYKYLYAIGTSVHAQDNAYEFPIWYNYLAPYSPSMYAQYIGSATSLILTGDPNTIRSPNLSSSAPIWPQFSNHPSDKYVVLNVSSSNNVSDSYVTSNGEGSGTPERCAFWAEKRLEGGF